MQGIGTLVAGNASQLGMIHPRLDLGIYPAEDPLHRIGSQEQAVLIQELESVPLGGIVARREDESTGGVGVFLHRHLDGRGGGNSQSHGIATTGHQGRHDGVFNHFTGIASVAPNEDAATADLLHEGVDIAGNEDGSKSLTDDATHAGNGTHQTLHTQ